MSAGPTTAAQLLKMDDREFTGTIQDMTVKKLLETISVLQKEMGKEQENFNSLSAELGNLKKNSGQYKSVSKDMTASQKRLTMLMDRSMKCFSQQGQQQSKESSTQTSSQKSSSQNRNSTGIPKSKSEVSTINPFVEVKSSNSADNSESVSTARTSFAEAKNKFSGSTQNGSPVLRPKLSNNPVDIKRSQSMTNTNSSKRLSADVSNGINVDARPKSDIEGVKSSKSEHTAVSNVSLKPVSSASKLTIGPLANQSNKFVSRSTDNVFNKSNDNVIDKDVVRGKALNSKPMVVMTADRQYLDLDSFTDRKNLLSELKNFNKELKPVSKANPDQPKLVKDFGFQDAPKENKTATQKTSLLNDIRLGKKPSDMKDKVNSVKEIKQSNSETKVSENNINGTKDTIGAKNKQVTYEPTDKDRVGVVNGKADSKVLNNKFETSANGVAVVINAFKEIDETDASTSEITVVEQTEALPVSSQSEDSESQSSEMSEDEDKYVTEFSFPQKPTIAHGGLKPIPEVTKPETKVNTDQTSKPNGQSVKKESSSLVRNSSTPTEQKSPGKTHVVKDNDEVLGAAARNQPEYNEQGEELVKQTRVNYSDWDPSLLLAELYKVNFMPDNIEDISHKFIGMEGLMEKLPMNKKKATLLKTWKRRFFRAKEGWLHYYESSNRDKPSDSLQLMGGKIEELGNQVLGIDDGRGKYLMVRVPTEHEYGQWKVALESQTADNVKATYVRPSPASAPNPKKLLPLNNYIISTKQPFHWFRDGHLEEKVIVIDMGSSGIRAGILGERATLPHVFIPSVVAINKTTKEMVVGADALKPEIRKVSNIVYPIRPTNRVDKFNIDMDVMAAILKKVFTSLKVNQKDYLVMLSTPQTLGNPLKEGLMRIFINQLHVKGVCMVQQALLALYSYNAMSGIIVDIGERLEILPIYEGLLIESGLSHQAYGGAKIQDSMYISLLENRYQFLTPVGRIVVRYICEQTCHVVDNYKDAKADCDKNNSKYTKTVDLTDFQLPEGAHESVSMDHACFKSPEGFFNTDLWEMDYKNIQKQIFAAVQQCPMDARKQMYRSIYLSGGVTMIPGFAERLQHEMEKLAPPAAVVEVHASPQRYHAAYIGACAVALMDVFEMSCVTAEEWNKMGVQACRKWGTN